MVYRRCKIFKIWSPPAGSGKGRMTKRPDGIMERSGPRTSPVLRRPVLVGSVPTLKILQRSECAPRATSCTAPTKKKFPVARVVTNRAGLDTDDMVSGPDSTIRLRRHHFLIQPRFRSQRFEILVPYHELHGSENCTIQVRASRLVAITTCFAQPLRPWDTAWQAHRGAARIFNGTPWTLTA